MREKQGNRKRKGVRVLYIGGGMVVVACILFALTVYGSISVSGRYYELTDSVDMYLLSEQEIREQQATSDFLTEQARRYASTMDRSYMDAYFETLHQARDLDDVAAGLAARQRDHSVITEEYLREMLERSDQLVQSEIHSMALISEIKGYDNLPDEVAAYEIPQWELWVDSEQQQSRAYSLVFNGAYVNTKTRDDARYAKALEDITKEAKAREQESAAVLRHALSQQSMYVFLFFALVVVVFLLLLWLIIEPITLFSKRIQEEQPLDLIGAYELRYLAETYNQIYEVNAASKAILQHQAEHDGLTDLLNRQAFEQLKFYLGTIQKPLALIIIDLDCFKSINDDYGHMVGDQALKKLANLLVEYFRTNDYLLRIGGDEFVAVMLDVTEAEKAIIAQKIESINYALLNPDDGLPRMSVSAGIAFALEGYTNDLYQNADSALYRTKENGRCGYSFYEQPMRGGSDAAV